MSKIFSAACERNAAPILQVLAPLLRDCRTVLEIGSGSGQHAVHFGAAMPHLRWQCSDRPQYHPSILAWQQESGLPNVLAPLQLEIGQSDWPPGPFDAVFSANTCHIMAWHEVEAMFVGVAKILREGGLFCLYGPFNYDGQFTSPSNQAFDASLKSQAPHMGLRDMADMLRLGRQVGLRQQDDLAMPANNRLLVFAKAPA